MDGLPEKQRQENFSHAYVRALAASCGFSVCKPEEDYDSVDLRVSARGTVTHGGCTSAATSPELNLQLKCTYAHRPKHGVLHYPLPIKNYNDLREPLRVIPIILVVLYVPKQWSQRLRWSEQRLAMSKIAYWKNLRGEPQTTNSESVTVTMNEHLSPDAFLRLMFMAAQGVL